MCLILSPGRFETNSIFALYVFSTFASAVRWILSVWPTAVLPLRLLLSALLTLPLVNARQAAG